MGTHPIFESDFDCLTHSRPIKMSSDQAIVTVKDTSVPEKRKTKKSKKEISKKKKKSKKTSPAAGEIKESKSLLSMGLSSEGETVYNPETIRWLNPILDDENLEEERILAYKEKRRERYKNSTPVRS